MSFLKEYAQKSSNTALIGQLMRILLSVYISSQLENANFALIGGVTVGAGLEIIIQRGTYSNASRSSTTLKGYFSFLEQNQC